MAEIIRNLLSDYCFSVCIQTFYRKSFNGNNVAQLSCFLPIGVTTYVFGHNVVVLTSSFVAVGYLTHRWRHEITLDRYFLARILFLQEYCNHIPSNLQFIGSPERAVLTQFLVSLIQFVRKPLSLKIRLQEIRAFMGPIFVLCSVRTFNMFRSDDLAPLHPWLCSISFASTVVALVGGVLFRPDNDYLLTKLFKWRTDTELRKRHHRNCMILSTLLSCGCGVYWYILRRMTTPSGSGLL